MLIRLITVKNIATDYPEMSWWVMDSPFIHNVRLLMKNKIWNSATYVNSDEKWAIIMSFPQMPAYHFKERCPVAFDVVSRDPFAVAFMHEDDAMVAKLIF